VHPNVCLLVAGDGACREDLGQLSRALAVADCVRFLGDRRDIPQVLSAMDLFVLPSIAEGLSNTVLEAMASGLPIVATRVGGNPELIDDGVNGMLVARQDPAALTGAVGRYLDDQHLRALHGKASRQRAVDHFGLEQMSDAYAKLYATLLGGRSERR